MVHVSVVLNTCVRNAADKPDFEVNKGPFPFQFLHALTPSLPSLYSCVTAQGWRGFLQVVSESGLSFTCDQDLADAPTPHLDYCRLLFTWSFQFLTVFSLKWSKTLLPKLCPRSPRDAALTQTCTWTSPPSLLACCFLISNSPWLNLSAVPNVLPVWLIAWLITSTCLSLWFLLLSQACTSLPGYLRPPCLVRWREECLCA